jgi:hypothetical protein
MAVPTVLIGALLGFTPHAFVAFRGGGTSLSVSRTAAAALKQAAADDDEERPPLINIGSICEFHDPKHGAGHQEPILGVVRTCEHKSKGGMRLSLEDAQGASHSVQSKAIHIVLPPFKGKEMDTATQLKDYLAVQAADPTELGVDVDTLELAWEMVATEDRPSFSPKHIMSEIDDKLFQGPVNQYKAFRLLTSDLGKVFFKALSSHMYKPKSAKSVSSSKDNWCRDVAEGSNSADWCFAV